jgi:hypothetical protein
MSTDPAAKRRQRVAWGVSPKNRVNDASEAPKGRQETGSSAPLSPRWGFGGAGYPSSWGLRPKLHAVAPSGLPKQKLTRRLPKWQSGGSLCRMHAEIT